MGTKSIKSNAEANAGIVVSNSAVRITSNEDNGFIADERGITLQGPVSIVSSTKHIRFGGLWTMSDPISLTLPSTMATPTPTLQMSPPIGPLKDLIKGAATMIALLSSFSAIG
jgi:hypothetical protein